MFVNTWVSYFTTFTISTKYFNEELHFIFRQAPKREINIKVFLYIFINLQRMMVATFASNKFSLEGNVFFLIFCQQLRCLYHESCEKNMHLK